MQIILTHKYSLDSMMFKICFIFNSYINSSNVPRGDTKGCNQIKTSKTKQQKSHMLAVFVPRSPPPKRSAMTETWGWCWNVMSSVWQDRRFHIHGDKHILLRLFTNSHQKNIWDSALRLTNSSKKKKKKKIRKKKTFQSHIWYKELVVYWNKKLYTSKKHNDGTNLSYKLFGSVCAAAAAGSVNVQLWLTAKSVETAQGCPRWPWVKVTWV